MPSGSGCVSVAEKFVENERAAVVVDQGMSGRVKGKILLQVEQNGEGWYVNPDTLKKHYLGRPSDAFNVMRSQGLGVKNDVIATTAVYPDRLLGKILINVDDSGKAYYINPKDRKAYYLGKPEDAFNVMRGVGTGISNKDIRKIEVGG